MAVGAPGRSPARMSLPVGLWNRCRPNSGSTAIRWSKMSPWMASYSTQAVVAVKQYSYSGTPSAVGSSVRTMSSICWWMRGCART